MSNKCSIPDVSHFTLDCFALHKRPMVDSDIIYMCPYNDKHYIRIVNNALIVPSMKQILLPPLIVRNAVVQVNINPKIQSN